MASWNRCRRCHGRACESTAVLACRRELLEWIEPGDELVEETFARLIPHGQIRAYEYDGFFGPMDTIKDLQRLEALQQSGDPPWRVRPATAPAAVA